MRLLAVAAISIALVMTLHAQAQFSFDYPAIARTLVRQLALRPGERVLSVAHPGLFEELLPHIRYEVMKAGGVDLGVIDVLPEPVPASWDLEIVARGARAAREHYKAMLREVDAAIMMPGA